MFDEVTRMVHMGLCEDGLLRTPAPPVQRGSTVLLEKSQHLYDGSFVNYGRGGLATHNALRKALAQLERAEKVFLYPSGLAAITGTIQALASTGEEVLLCDSVYGPTRRFLTGTMQRFGVSARYYRTDASIEEIAALITPATCILFLESPGSLTLDMQDVPAIARMAREHGVLTVMDNTYAAGVLFKPLDHGVDVSIQSLTKYVCGHSDVFMGMAATRGEVGDLLAKSAYEVGWAVSPDDAYLALRGLRTLHMRLVQHGEAALRIAGWLRGQPEVAEVICPGLPGDRGYDIWKRDFAGLCGLVSIVLQPVSEDAVARMLNSLRLFGLGYSWGGFESLAIPCDPQLASRTFCAPWSGPVVRLHVGLESTEDLINDLRHGLDQLGSDRWPEASNRMAAI